MTVNYLVKNNTAVTHFSEAELKHYKELERERKRIDSNYRRKQNYHGEKSLDENVSRNGKYSERYEIIQSSAQNGLNVLLEKEEEECIAVFVSELPSLQRQAYIAMIINGLNATQASQLLNKSDKTVKKYCKLACIAVYSKLYQYKYGEIWNYKENKNI